MVPVIQFTSARMAYYSDFYLREFYTKKRYSGK